MIRAFGLFCSLISNDLLSYKLFNLQAAAFKAKYSFLCRDVYVHRYNPKSVSFNYRPDPHLIWLGIAYKLKYTFDKGIPSPLWKQMIAYTIFFGCFFDSKMVYLHSGKKISAIKELLVEYSRDPLSTTSFKMLSDNRNLNRIPSFLYRIFIGGFAFFMKRHMFSAIAIGIKIIVDTKIDERLSDTGKKPHK